MKYFTDTFQFGKILMVIVFAILAFIQVLNPIINITIYKLSLAKNLLWPEWSEWSDCKPHKKEVFSIDLLFVYI